MRQRRKVLRFARIIATLAAVGGTPAGVRAQVPSAADSTPAGAVAPEDRAIRWSFDTGG